MAEPNEASSAELDRHENHVDASHAQSLFSVPVAIVQTATAAGYGLWMVLGASLALALYPDGRGEVLVPLAIGLVLASTGLIATCLRLRFAPAWHGWNPVKRMMPTPEGLVAMGNYLPMLALAGLARGGNDFWATRLAGGVLTLCSLATLVYTARAAMRPLTPALAVIANVTPLGRTVSAALAGGLWFWLCLATQAPAALGDPWRMVLLGVALAAGVAEGARWRALRRVAAERGVEARVVGGRWGLSLLGSRFGVAALSVGLPCVLLVAHGQHDLPWLLAGVGTLSCAVGQCLEQRLYGMAYLAVAAE